jgi:hypothetical protein
VNIQSGVLEVAGGGADSSATFNIAKGAELYVPVNNWGSSMPNTLTGTVSYLGAGLVDLDGGAIVGGAGGATIQVGSTTTFDWSSGYLGAPVGTTIELAGSFHLIGTSQEVVYGGGTVELLGTIKQSGTGSLRIDGTNTTATTLAIAGGSTYDLAADSGIVQGSNDGGVVNDAGTMAKTGGIGVSTIATPLTNTGTVAVSTGTLDINGAVGLINGTTLQAGTWTVASTPKVAATLTFAAPTSLSGLGMGAAVTLSGPNSTFTNLAGLASNAGTLSLAGGASFTTTGAFANSGTLSLGAGDTLDVNGKYTQTAAAALNVTIAGTAASGQFGRIATNGPAALAGTLNVTVPSSFSPTVGDSYTIAASSGDSGAFGAINGTTLPNSKVLTPAYQAKAFTLTVAAASSAVAAPVDGPVALADPAAVDASQQGDLPSTTSAIPAAMSASPTITSAAKGYPGHARPFLTGIRPARGHRAPMGSTGYAHHARAR